MEERRDKINYYLDIAETVASRSTCLRKKYGSVIVNHDQIISTGYSGAPRGRINCCDLGYCTKKKLLPDQDMADMMHVVLYIVNKMQL